MIQCQVNRVLFKQKGLVRTLRYIHDDMSKVLYPLKSRKLLQVSGNDAADFLQGLITNDIRHLQEGANSMYAMFLNHKGRILYDTLIHKWASDREFMLECDQNVLSLLQRHLNIYKLRRKVEIKDISPLFQVWALIIPPHEEIEYNIDIERNINVYHDPRLRNLGLRLITTKHIDKFDLQEAVGKDTVLKQNEEGYKYLRHRLGVSEGAEELFPGSCLPLEANCDYLHGVSFHKGCYIGQELTARVHHTGVVRKRIMPLRFTNTLIVDDLEKDAPIVGQPATKSNIGKLKSYTKDYGLGLVRIKEALEAKTLNIGQYSVELIMPSWWPVEAPKEKLHPAKLEAAVNETV